MEAATVIVPDWMNWLSLPILLIGLLILDYCAAVWMQPTHIPNLKKETDSTTKDIFSLLVIFSIIGILVGLLAATTNISTERTIIFELGVLVFLAWALLPKKLWLVAGACYEVAFIVGQTIINYNALFAILLTVVMVIIILIMAITIGPLRSINPK